MFQGVRIVGVFGLFQVFVLHGVGQVSLSRFKRQGGDVRDLRAPFRRRPAFADAVAGSAVQADDVVGFFYGGLYAAAVYMPVGAGFDPTGKTADKVDLITFGKGVFFRLVGVVAVFRRPFGLLCHVLLLCGRWVFRRPFGNGQGGGHLRPDGFDACGQVQVVEVGGQVFSVALFVPCAVGSLKTPDGFGIELGQGDAGAAAEEGGGLAGGGKAGAGRVVVGGEYDALLLRQTGSHVFGNADHIAAVEGDDDGRTGGFADAGGGGETFDQYDAFVRFAFEAAEYGVAAAFFAAFEKVLAARFVDGLHGNQFAALIQGDNELPLPLVFVLADAAHQSGFGNAFALQVGVVQIDGCIGVFPDAVGFSGGLAAGFCQFAGGGFVAGALFGFALGRLFWRGRNVGTLGTVAVVAGKLKQGGGGDAAGFGRGGLPRRFDDAAVVAFALPRPFVPQGEAVFAEGILDGNGDRIPFVVGGGSGDVAQGSLNFVIGGWGVVVGHNGSPEVEMEKGRLKTGFRRPDAYIIAPLRRYGRHGWWGNTKIPAPTGIFANPLKINLSMEFPNMKVQIRARGLIHVAVRIDNKVIIALIMLLSQ